MARLPDFATVDPFDGMTGADPGVVQNLVAGEWHADTALRDDIVDPLNGELFLKVPDTTDYGAFINGLGSCPKTGLHNPFHNPHRYVDLGRVCARAAALLAEPDIEKYFVRLLQRVVPKSWSQCLGEVTVTRVFLENFAGDGVRFLARGFSNPGDHRGQESRGYRWPYGPVAVVAPFNFPLEIPALQVMGALFMGNRPLVKADSKVSVVFEQFVRLLIHSGLPPTDLDLIHCRGSQMGKLIDEANDRDSPGAVHGLEHRRRTPLHRHGTAACAWRTRASTGRSLVRTTRRNGSTTSHGSRTRTPTTRPARNARHRASCSCTITGTRRCCRKSSSLPRAATLTTCPWDRC
ncbi:MAG: aldehyde dehydrogenase family protein [Woeseiaceae bacterium]|nr:aldehyde dehydrogenase family protein [Woeseiaceae bacterium]